MYTVRETLATIDRHIMVRICIRTVATRRFIQLTSGWRPEDLSAELLALPAGRTAYSAAVDYMEFDAYEQE